MGAVCLGGSLTDDEAGNPLLTLPTPPKEKKNIVWIEKRGVIQRGRGGGSLYSDASAQ